MTRRPFRGANVACSERQWPHTETPREEQVVSLVADGLKNREIAAELGLSEHTVKKYLLRIFDKLGICTRVELALYAVSHGENHLAEWMPGSV